MKKRGSEAMWLLCDYGEVLSLPQPTEDVKAMADASGCDEKEFIERYWKYRPDYDRADVSGAQYWELVTESDLDRSRLDTLIRLDVRSWSYPSTPALEATARAAERGYQLAILSNAPAELADALGGVSWLETFHPKIFSCRLRVNKPEPTIYTHALTKLSATPSDVIFFDDRTANVAAARELGIQAYQFANASQIDDLALPN